MHAALYGPVGTADHVSEWKSHPGDWQTETKCARKEEKQKVKARIQGKLRKDRPRRSRDRDSPDATLPATTASSL